MNKRVKVLRSKEKYQKIFSTENILFHASGDAAAGERCCRLCGGDASLRAVGDTYTCDGVEERYDRLLFECFGVTVSTPDSLLCEWCVRQLHNTDKFRVMVHAALDKPLSSSNLLHYNKQTAKHQKSDRQEAAVISYGDIIDLFNNKPIDGVDRSRKRKITEKNYSNLNQKPCLKRTNVQCNVCKRMCRYWRRDMERYICSRCQKDKSFENNGIPPKSVLRKQTAMHGKKYLSERNRRLGSPKIPSILKYQEIRKTHGVPKYICPVCPKKYMTSQHLVEHLKCMHGNKRAAFSEICRLDNGMESFEKHIHIRRHRARKQTNLQK